jgi:hypothetical protein
MSSLGLGRATIPACCSVTPAASLTHEMIFVSKQSRVNSEYEGREDIDIGRLFTNPGSESNRSLDICARTKPGEWEGEVVSRGGEGIDIGRLFTNPGREFNT